MSEQEEGMFRVNKNLGTLMMLTAALAEKTYSAPGADHAPPAFLGRNGADISALYYEGPGEGIDDFREQTFDEKLGAGEDQYEAMVFFSEAWVVMQERGTVRTERPSEAPDRREAVIYEARDIRGNRAQARQFIDRSGPRPVLGEFRFIPTAGYAPSTSAE